MPTPHRPAPTPSPLTLAVWALLACVLLAGLGLALTDSAAPSGAEPTATSCCPDHAPPDAPDTGAEPVEAPDHDCPPGCHDCPGCALAGTVVPVSRPALPSACGSLTVVPRPLARLTTPAESPVSRIFHPPRSGAQA